MLDIFRLSLHPFPFMWLTEISEHCLHACFSEQAPILFSLSTIVRDRETVTRMERGPRYVWCCRIWETFLKSSGDVIADFTVLNRLHRERDYTYFLWPQRGATRTRDICGLNTRKTFSLRAARRRKTCLVFNRRDGSSSEVHNGPPISFGDWKMY